MNGVLSLVTAELLELDLFGHRLLVLCRGVVPVFTLGTLERDDFSTRTCHEYSLKVVWSPRRELNS